MRRKRVFIYAQRNILTETVYVRYWCGMEIRFSRNVKNFIWQFDEFRFDCECRLWTDQNVVVIYSLSGRMYCSCFMRRDEGQIMIFSDELTSFQDYKYIFFFAYKKFTNNSYCIDFQFFFCFIWIFLYTFGSFSLSLKMVFDCFSLFSQFFFFFADNIQLLFRRARNSVCSLFCCHNSIDLFTISSAVSWLSLIWKANRNYLNFLGRFRLIPDTHTWNDF